MNIDELNKKSKELEQRRESVREKAEVPIQNIHLLADESIRVAKIAHDSEKILNDLDNEFERQTGLNGVDVSFLFFAIAMQCARIFFINQMTKIENAGTGNEKEDFLHRIYKKLYSKKTVDPLQAPARLFYAPFNQIISTKGVPYDATASLTEESIKRLLEKNNSWSIDVEKYIANNKGLFKGANHRFSTLGHDPVLGLIFGTTNILTNTITCIHAPIITTNHVIYTDEYTDPRIATKTSTLYALYKAVKRFDDDKKSIVAAIIKHILHILSDLYTPKGIQIPGANLIMSNSNAEELTKYIDTGTIIKAGMSAKISVFINFLVSTVHNLLYDKDKYDNREVYNVKTRKIIMLSNTIASGLNVGYVGANMASGNEMAIKDLDIGGLIITINRLLTDSDYIRKVKEDFIFGKFNKLIQGDPLNLMEVK